MMIRSPYLCVTVSILGLVATFFPSATAEVVEGTWSLRGGRGASMFEGQLFPGAGKGFFNGRINVEFLFTPHSATARPVRFDGTALGALLPANCVAAAPEVTVDSEPHHFVWKSGETLGERQRAVAAAVAWERQKARLLPRGSVQSRGNSIVLLWNTDADFVITHPINITCGLGGGPHTLNGDVVSPATFSLLLRPSQPSIVAVNGDGNLLNSFTAKGKRQVSTNTKSKRDLKVIPVHDITEFKARHDGLNLTFGLNNDLFTYDPDAGARDAALLATARAMLRRLRCAPLPCLRRQAPRYVTRNSSEPIALEDIESEVWQYANDPRPISTLLAGEHLEPILLPEDAHPLANRRYISFYVPPEELRHRGFDLKSGAELRRMFKDDKDGGAPSVEELATSIDNSGYRIFFDESLATSGEDAVTVKGPHLTLGGRGDAAGFVLLPEQKLPSRVSLSYKTELNEWDPLFGKPLRIGEDCINGFDSPAFDCDGMLVVTLIHQALPGHEFQFRVVSYYDIINETFTVAAPRAELGSLDGDLVRYFRSSFVNMSGISTRHGSILRIGYKRQLLPVDISKPIVVSLQIPNTALQLFDEPWRQATRLEIVPAPGRLTQRALAEVDTVAPADAPAVAFGISDWEFAFEVDIVGETLALNAATDESQLAVFVAALHPFAEPVNEGCALETSPAVASSMRSCLSVTLDGEATAALTTWKNGFAVKLRVQSTCSSKQWDSVREDIKELSSRVAAGHIGDGRVCPLVTSVAGTSSNSVVAVDLWFVPPPSALRSGIALGYRNGVPLRIELEARKDEFVDEL